MAALNNEYEVQFFGFSARGFVDLFYNNLVENWAVVVEQVLIPTILQKVEETNNGFIITKKAKKLLKDKLLDRLFQNGKLDLILKDGQSYLERYIFTIPKNITLPEDEINQQLEEYDEDKFFDKVRVLTLEILELQLKSNRLNQKHKYQLVISAIDQCLQEVNNDKEQIKIIC